MRKYKRDSANGEQELCVHVYITQDIHTVACIHVFYLDKYVQSSCFVSLQHNYLSHFVGQIEVFVVILLSKHCCVFRYH